MPRFYFHFDDGRSRKPDPEGMILPDAEAAWYQGVRSAREIILSEFPGLPVTPGPRFEIVDEEGQPVWAVPFDEVAGLAM